VRILITNDDGINACGIKALVMALSSLGNLYVIAPSGERSACGHGITIREPIKINKYDFPLALEAWSVEGTPADCVKLGITTLLKEKPDLVVSGINQGPNLGTDIFYSGTVSAAIEAILLGVPAIAISLASHTSQDFSVAQKTVKILSENMLKKELAPDTLLNVNVPALSLKNIKGFKVTKLGERKYINNFEHKKIGPNGTDYYLLTGQAVLPEKKEEDLDVIAVENGYISITPIHFDLTNYRIMEQIKQWGIENKGF